MTRPTRAAPHQRGRLGPLFCTPLASLPRRASTRAPGRVG